MAQRPFIVGIAAALAVACGVAVYLRFGSSSPAPVARQSARPADSPSSASSAASSLEGPRERVPTISESNAAATFINVQQCINLPTMLAIHRRNADCGLASRPDPESQARYATCLDNTSAQREIVRKLEDQQRACGGYDLTPAGLFTATKEAAEHGDERARLCFIWGMFADRQRDKVGLPQSDVDAYPALASKYIQEGLARGDWRTVVILTQPVPFGSLLGSTNFGVGTQETEYKMFKLLQLGANKDFAATLADRLNSLAHDTNPPMTADAAAAGDQWAQDMYVAHFAGSAERLDDMPADGCALPSDATP